MSAPRRLRPATYHGPPGLAAHLAGWRRLEDVEPENSSEVFQSIQEADE